MFRSALHGLMLQLRLEGQGLPETAHGRSKAKHESILKVSVYISSTHVILIIDSYMAKATVRVTSKLRGKGCGCKILFQGSGELGTIIQPAMELLQRHLSSCLLETNASGYR